MTTPNPAERLAAEEKMLLTGQRSPLPAMPEQSPPSEDEEPRD